jgi:phosphoglycerate dehydrogenase-like enzyme
MPTPASRPSRPSVFFSAPHDFLGALLDGYGTQYELELGEVWFERDLPARCDADAWVVNPGQHFVVDDAVLAVFPRLRALVTPSTGTNHIDVDACCRRGVEVRGLLDAREALERISASAEFTFLHVLNALRRIDVGLAEAASGRWRLDEGRLRGRELQGKRAGLVGYGRIGRRLARYLAAFDAGPTAFYDPYVEGDGAAVRNPSLEELATAADVLVICCALTDETHGLVDGALLRRLPAGAVVVNTSRGEVLDEPSVAAALAERPDLVLSVDVVTGEVRGRQHESPLADLHRSGRVLLTPHIAGVTVESQRKAAEAAMALVGEALAAG